MNLADHPGVLPAAGLEVGRATGAIAIALVLGCSGVGEQGGRLLDPHDPVPVGSLRYCLGPLLPDLGLHLAKGISGINPGCGVVVVPTGEDQL